MTSRRMTPAEHFDELEALGANVELDDATRAIHRIDRNRLHRDGQCCCTCGAICQSWVVHLTEAREQAELWSLPPRRIMLGAGQFEPTEVGECCGHEYGRHLVGLDGCADCERLEVPDDRCTSWRRQMPERRVISTERKS